MAITPEGVTSTHAQLEAKPIDSTLKSLPLGHWSGINEKAVHELDGALTLDGNASIREPLTAEQRVSSNRAAWELNVVNVVAGFVLDLTDTEHEILPRYSNLGGFLSCMSHEPAALENGIPVVGLIRNIREFWVVANEVASLRNNDFVSADLRRTLVPTIPLGFRGH